MSGVLLVFVILSIGAVALATYVFTVAARNYVSDPIESEEAELDCHVFIERSNQDRRRAVNVLEFPITLGDGEVVLHDRRKGERRAAG